MKNISELSLQEVCNYIACMNKLVEEKIVIFKPNKAFIKFNYDKATRHLEKQNIEQKEEIERLNNIINETSEKLQKIINEVNNKTLINVGQFAIRLEAIQDELVGGSDK